MGKKKEYTVTIDDSVAAGIRTEDPLTAVQAVMREAGITECDEAFVWYEGDMGFLKRRRYEDVYTDNENFWLHVH